MRLWKLTDAKDQTRGGCQWGENVTVLTSGFGPLCGSGFTHWYTDPLLAVFLNQIHGRFDLDTAHLWEGEGEVAKTDGGLKVGCTKATTIRRVELPHVTREQTINFGILVALEVYRETTFVTWAQAWLRGSDRTCSSAYAAGYAAYAVADAVAYAAYAAYAAATAEDAGRSLDLIALAHRAIE